MWDSKRNALDYPHHYIKNNKSPTTRDVLMLVNTEKIINIGPSANFKRYCSAVPKSDRKRLFLYIGLHVFTLQRTAKRLYSKTLRSRIRGSGKNCQRPMVPRSNDWKYRCYQLTSYNIYHGYLMFKPYRGRLSYMVNSAIVIECRRCTHSWAGDRDKITVVIMRRI